MSKKEFFFLCDSSYLYSQDVQRVTLQSKQRFLSSRTGVFVVVGGYQISLSLLLLLRLAEVFGRRRRICGRWDVSMRRSLRLDGCEDWMVVKISTKRAWAWGPTLTQASLATRRWSTLENSHGEITVDFAVPALVPHLH